MASPIGGGDKGLGQIGGKAKPLREAIEKLLGDEARPGCPPIFSAEQVCQLIALACETPPEPLEHWTHEDVAREVIKRGEARKNISKRSLDSAALYPGYACLTTSTTAPS